jgi:hydroxymethylbilane synthase
VGAISDPAAAAALDAERALVNALGGGCQTPIGALAVPLDNNRLELGAAVVALDGSRAVRGRVTGPWTAAADLGATLGRQLLDDGADEILAEVRRADAAVEGIQP